MNKLLYAVLFLMVCAQAAADGDIEAGKRLYSVCAGCHGFQGEGNVTVASPKVAAQEPWYLTRQLQYFQQGIRGSATDDIHGRQMAPMALALTDARALEDVISYIGTLPDVKPAATVTGDTASGQQLYAVCSACHGLLGEGIEALSSPRLADLDDWYIVNQLKLYAVGLRGTHPSDTYGQQMVPIVAALEGEQAIRDLAAYIATLN